MWPFGDRVTAVQSPAVAGATTPWWVRAASQVLRRLPAGRYRASSLLSRAALPPFMARTLESQGALAFHVEWKDHIARDVCLLGVYEPQETALLRELLRPGMTFLDVGANWGYFTLLGAHLTGAAGRVIALEPDPRLVPLLRRNVEVNGLGHVEVLPLAAAATTGSFLLRGHDACAENRGTSRLTHDQTDGAPAFWVTTTSLDALLDARHVDTVDLLKMDIEGAEALALEGMRAGLSRHRYTRIILELHPTMLEEHGSSVRAIVELLRGAGYQGWWVDHSARAVRRASYTRRLRPGEYLRPIEGDEPSDGWPHTLWLAPHLVPAGAVDLATLAQ